MKLPRRRFLHLAAGAAVLPATSCIAKAQTYPARPVQVIVPYGPGGPTDVFARLVCAGRPYHARDRQQLVINPSFFDKVPYDPYKDFEPVTLAVASTNVLIVNSSVPATTVKEFIAIIRANPGKYSFASTGGGNPGYLAAESLRLSLGLDIVQVPYNSGGPATAAVVAGHAQIGIVALAVAPPLIQPGNLRALAVMSKTRFQNLSAIPTIAEAGYPEIKADSWVGVLMPARTPKQILTLLNREIAGIVTQADMKDRWAALGFEPVVNTPEEFADLIKDDFQTWAKVIRAVNIKAR